MHRRRKTAHCVNSSSATSPTAPPSAIRKILYSKSSCLHREVSCGYFCSGPASACLASCKGFSLDPPARNCDDFPDIGGTPFMGLYEAGEMLGGDFSDLEPLFVDAGNWLSWMRRRPVRCESPERPYGQIHRAYLRWSACSQSPWTRRGTWSRTFLNWVLRLSP
jgi:hypothetical protein